MAEKYLDLSGLQAFYDKLKTTAFVDSALSADSTKPVQNRIVASHFALLNTDLTTLKNASGTWDAKQDAIEDLDSIRNSAKSGWSAWSAVTGNSGTWATDTNTIAAMTDVATYFNGTSALSALTAKSALSAGSASKAAALSNTAYKVASATSATNADTWTNARTIAASGDVTWSIITSGSSNVTGNATINSVPAAAISSVPWSAIDDYAAAVDTTTTNKFTTPKAVNDAITAAMTTKAAFRGPYATRGDIPSTELDKLSIYLIGPSGTGVDKYEEWVLTGTTTAQMLQIGDTSTNLSDYLKTTTFNSWSGSTNSIFSGKAKSADNAAALGGTAAANVIGSAKSGQSAYNWITGNSSNIETASGYAKDWNDTKDSLTGLTGIKNYATIAAKSGTASKGTFTASTTADTFTFVAGNNIDFVSAANSLTISAKSYTIPTVNNNTISITTGASPATGSFTLNQNSNKTITLGSMALKASGDFIGTAWSGATASNFSGTSRSATNAANLGGIAASKYYNTINFVPYTSAEVTAGITW